jgi:hypothetical protein
MQEAYKSAREKAALTGARGKKYYDKKLNYTTLRPGDRVLVRNLTPRGGPGKLRAYWEDKVHVVVKQRGEGPVYEVRPEGQGRRVRTLHRNILLPCDFLTNDDETLEVRQLPRSQRARRNQRNQLSDETTSDESESDDELVMVTNQPVMQNEEEIRENRQDVVDDESDNVSSTSSGDESKDVTDHIEDEANDGVLIDEHQPVQPAPVQPEPVQAEPLQPDTDQPDTVQPDTVQPEIVQPEIQGNRYPRRVRIPPARYGYNPMLFQMVHQPTPWYQTVQQQLRGPPWCPWTLAASGYRPPTPVNGFTGQGLYGQAGIPVYAVYGQ